MENVDNREHNDKLENYPSPTFKVYISSLVLQAMIFFGRIENPITGKMEKNIAQGKYLIDTLDLIREKTKGNLTQDEETFLNDSLFDLRLIYMEEVNKK